METKNVKLGDAIFIVTEEDSCPYYDLGDELKVEKSGLTASSFKPVCLYLSREIEKIVTAKESFSNFPRLGLPKNESGRQKSHYDCGGCTGSIRFEFKQKKEYATLQMKLLKESEEQRRRNHLRKFYSLLRKMDLFSSLEDEALSDLVLFLDFKTVLPDKVLLKKGDNGTYLHIILKGQVAVVDGNNQKISELNTGEIFGELSLLSNEPETHSFHTVGGTQVAMLSVKNFRHILKKHPALQIFLFKLLIVHVQAKTLRSGNIVSGMSGNLEEIAVVDLMQLINSSQKTGSVMIKYPDGEAHVFFREGEIIHGQLDQLQGKDAVYGMLGIKQGLFSFSRGIPDELKTVPPLGGFIGLMMEGVQRLDEEPQ